MTISAEEVIEGALVEADLAPVNSSVVEKWLRQLPEKALGLGIRVLITVIFLGLGILAIRFVRKIVKKGMEKAGADQSVIGFVDSCLKFILYAVLLLSIATNYGFDAASVVAILGSAGLTLGLALQGALSNFAGGVLILILKPFKVGDYIKDSAGNEGTVTEIAIFYTTLYTLEHRVTVVPNGTLANSSLTNMTALDYVQFDLTVPVSYDTNIKEVKSILESIIREAPGINHHMKTIVFLKEFGDSAMIIGYRAFVKTDSYWPAKWLIQERIKEEFDAHGISIPFQQVDIHLEEKMS